MRTCTGGFDIPLNLLSLLMPRQAAVPWHLCVTERHNVTTCCNSVHAALCCCRCCCCYCDHLQHLAFVKSLERRIDGARFTLNRQLQSALGVALSSAAWGAAGHCLRGFLELAEAGHAEEGLRQHLVGPLIRQVVTDVRQQQLQAGPGAGGSGSTGAAAGSSGSPLSQVVALSLSRLRQDAGPLLAQLTAPGSGLGGIDLLGAVLLAELSTAVADGLPGKQQQQQDQQGLPRLCLGSVSHKEALNQCMWLCDRDLARLQEAQGWQHCCWACAMAASLHRYGTP